MFAQATPCQPEKIQQLLDDQLPESDQTKLAIHVETCAHCRRQLENLAAEDCWWIDVREALSGVSCDEGLSPGEPGQSFDGEMNATEIPLNFLSRSDNPAMLGRLGEFEILERIGCGGMGIVLKGYDQELNRYVAIKILHPVCATSAAARRRFVREAQSAASIVHANVVSIHAVDASHHPPYLVMSYIPGESLQQRLARQGPLELTDALRIGCQVSEGLAAAHAQGIVHRDIKPGNILLERNVERVLLTDFGLARAADDASLTQSGIIAGTPQYMSPEQARGEQIDHRADLFSLGTVLYAMLAGHSPFRSESAIGVLRRVCDDSPRDLREINPTVPDWLQAFISKLHAKQPSQRFDSATGVAELLKAMLAHVQQPMLSPLPNELIILTRNSNRPAKRIRFTLKVVAGAFVAVIGVLGLARFIAQNSVEVVVPSPPVSSTATRSESSESDDWRDGLDRDVEQVQKSLNRLETDAEF